MRFAKIIGVLVLLLAGAIAASGKGPRAVAYTTNGLLSPCLKLMQRAGYAPHAAIDVAQTYTTCTTPTPAPNSTPSNGPDWPTGFVPYAPNSIWNSPLPTTTTFPYASNSSAVMGTIFPGSDFGTFFPFINEPQTGDSSWQIYFAKVTDPVVTITGCSPTGWFGAPNCRGIGPGFNPGGAGTGKIYIPSYARAQGSDSTDNALIVIQPNGDEIDFEGYDAFHNGAMMPPGWSTANNTAGAWTNGGTLPMNTSAVMIGSDCGNFFTGSGWYGSSSVTGGSSTGGTVGQGGQCGGAGLLHPRELASGTIPHALYMTAHCTTYTGGGNAVYPSGGDGPFPSCTGNIPLVGQRVWYDVPCDASSPGHVGFVGTYTRSTSLQPYAKALLCALNQYGGFILDNGSDSGAMTSGLGIRDWGEVNALMNAVTDPGAILGAQGWTGGAVTGDWSASYKRWWQDPAEANWAPAGVTFNGHMHILCESVTEGGVGCH